MTANLQGHDGNWINTARFPFNYNFEIFGSKTYTKFLPPLVVTKLTFYQSGCFRFSSLSSQNLWTTLALYNSLRLHFFLHVRYKICTIPVLMAFQVHSLKNVRVSFILVFVSCLLIKIPFHSTEGTRIGPVIFRSRSNISPRHWDTMRCALAYYFRY